MKALLQAFALAAVLGSSAVSAADAGPGASRGGSAPSEGAIKGGSILPGERGDVPAADKPSDAERAKRCNELSGTLRADCLQKEQSSSTGGTQAPDSGGARTQPSRDEPPPQNPR